MSGEDDFRKERDLVIEIEREASNHYDKNLLWAAGGALALSITFMREIAPLPTAKGLLFTSWAFLIFSVLTTLVSFQTTQLWCADQHRILEAGRAGDYSQKNKWENVSRTLNFVSITLFIAGLICLCVFAGINL